MAVRGELKRLTDGELTGVSCLAERADQIFAQVVLDKGGIWPDGARRD